MTAEAVTYVRFCYDELTGIWEALDGFGAGDGTVTQNRGFIPDPQRRNTYSPLPDIAGRYEPGTVSFPMLIKPRAAGTAPDGGQLLEIDAFGRESERCLQILRQDDEHLGLRVDVFL